MKRFIFSAIIATSFHIAIMAFMPTPLKKIDKIIPPEIKQVLVTLSYKQPTKEKISLKPDKQKKEAWPIQEIKRIKPEPEINPIPETEPEPVTEPEIVTKPNPLTKPATKPAPKSKIYYPLKKKANALLKKKNIARPLKKPQQDNPISHNPKQEKKEELPPVKPVESAQIKTPKKENLEKQAAPLKKIIPQKKEPGKQDHIEFAKPLYKKNPSPLYPVIAQKRGFQGIVELSVLVSKKGEVSSIKIFKSSGYKSLDRKAVAAVKNWRFEPGQKNGVIQEMWVKIPIKFELK